MKDVNVLFLGGAKRVSFAGLLIDEGEKLGLNVQLFSYELEKTVPLVEKAEIIVGLKWNDPNIYEHLSDIIDKKKINVVIPFVDPAIIIACELKKLHDEVFIPISDKELCKIMFDKKLSEEWFLGNNIPIPKSYNTINDVDKYPVILKPRTGSASKGLLIIDTEEDLLKTDNISLYVIQAFIKRKKEYTVDCYVSQNGVPLCIVPRIRLEVAGGEAVKAMTCRDPQIIGLSEHVLSAGNFRGAVTIQFIKDLSTDEVFIMEVNTRLGGGVIASIYAGANIPSFIIKEAKGRSATAIDNWKDKTLMTRYFKEVIFYADNH